jgi:hypothetical protein
VTAAPSVRGRIDASPGLRLAAEVLCEGEVGGTVTATGLIVVQDGKEKRVDVQSEDIVIATLGSMVANSLYGTK